MFLFSKLSEYNCLSRTLITRLLLTLTITVTSCEKDEDDDEYYVRYEASSTLSLTSRDLDISYRDNTNQQVTIRKQTNQYWEVIIGPVKRDYKAELWMDMAGNYTASLYPSIHVSKNGSPFALKKYGGGDIPINNEYITYTIDY